MSKKDIKQEWFAAKELVGIAGFPQSLQAINQRARTEGWIKRRRVGVQGRALEYHIDSLPAKVTTALKAKESPGSYLETQPDPRELWVTIYHQMTTSEREWLVALILREGLSSILSRLGIERQDKA